MSELLKVHFISPDIRTCFFYLNNLDLYREHYTNVWGIKIQYGKNYELTTFGSIHLRVLPEVPDKCIGLTPLLANRLGLKENDHVLVSTFVAPSVESLEILPKREEDYFILLSCKSIIEKHLMDQVRIVSEGQIFPIHVFSNIVIDLEIGKCKPEMKTGRLEKFTEITVLRPSEKPSGKTSQTNLEHFIDKFNNSLKSKERFSSESRGPVIEWPFNHFECKEKTNDKFIIWPKFLAPQDLPSKVLDKFIVILNIDNVENFFGPHSVKLFCKVESIRNHLRRETVQSSEDDDESKNDYNDNDYKNDDKEKKSDYLYSYVIGINSDCNNYNSNHNGRIAFCPPYVMKKLKLFVGSEIRIKKVELNRSVDMLPEIKLDLTGEATKFHFWKGMEDIKSSTINNVFNNIKFNLKGNTLIVGGPGTGKTTLLSALEEKFSNEFIFNKTIHCKPLRGKKLESLYKLWKETLTVCCCHQPAILILEDLHSLTYVCEDEDQSGKLYSNRIAEMITELLKTFQENHKISVIATTNGLPELGNLIFSHGPRLFQIIKKIPEMTTSDRHFALSNFIKLKSKNLKTDLLDLNKIAESTNGYTIQDLRDLVDKAILKCFVRDDNLSLSQADFDSALSESVPLLLRGIKLRESTGKKWEDVGGMEHPKRVLMEVFSWPSIYPELLQSCPLRLQRGVLLYGAPGTGKTLLAGALAEKCGLNFITVKGPEILSKYVGASEEGVRNLFVQAQKTQPCLLFFDEFDSLAAKRGHDSTGVTDRVVNQLLTQLDGVETLNGVWVLASTSRPDLLDPALLRPGRLDKLVFCDIPNKADRLSILNALSKNLSKSGEVDFEEIVEKSEGYTGADLQAILYNAQMLAIKERENDLQNGVDIKVEQKHLLAAFEDTKPSLTPSEKLRYANIYDEFINSRKKNSTRKYSGMIQRITLA